MIATKSVAFIFMFDKVGVTMLLGMQSCLIWHIFCLFFLSNYLIEIMTVHSRVIMSSYFLVSLYTLVSAFVISICIAGAIGFVKAVNLNSNFRGGAMLFNFYRLTAGSSWN